MDSRATYQDGHRILYRGSFVGPTRVLLRDPCFLGLTEMLTVAHVEGVDCQPGIPLLILWFRL